MHDQKVECCNISGHHMSNQMHMPLHQLGKKASENRMTFQNNNNKYLSKMLNETTTLKKKPLDG